MPPRKAISNLTGYLHDAELKIIRLGHQIITVDTGSENSETTSGDEFQVSWGV